MTKKSGAFFYTKKLSNRISTELFRVPTVQTCYCYTENAVRDRKMLILPNELKLKIT